MAPTADEWPFHVDHVLARVHGGDDVDHNGPALVECIIDRDDCSKNLLE